MIKWFLNLFKRKPKYTFWNLPGAGPIYTWEEYKNRFLEK